MTQVAEKEGALIEQQELGRSHPVLQSEGEIVAATPFALIQMAVQQNAPIEKLQQLLDLQERWEKNEAQKAFAQAMTAFHADPPTVYKNKLVSFTNNDGSTTSYRHTTLDHLAAACSEKMSQHGLSFRWSVERQDGGMIQVTCIIQHALGHCERVTLSAGLDQSGKKNNIQQMGSTIRYLQRYTLETAAGVASEDPLDDDGRSAEPEPERQEPRATKPESLPPYPLDKFETNLPTWRKAIEDGRKKAEDVIATVGSKYRLSEGQIKKIKGEA